MSDEPWTEEKAQKMAECVSEMTKERLAKLYVVNLFPAVLAGKDSVFGRLQQAIKDEMWRREAKKKGEKQHAQNLTKLLELVGNAEASLLATTFTDPDRIEEFLRDGLVRLERAIGFAKSSGYDEVAEQLEGRGAAFADARTADDRASAANALREARIELRLALNAATDAAGMLRVPPAQVAVHGPRKSEKIPRNQPCPCGSGRKYKRCCGAN